MGLMFGVIGSVLWRFRAFLQKSIFRNKATVEIRENEYGKGISIFVRIDTTMKNKRRG